MGKGLFALLAFVSVSLLSPAAAASDEAIVVTISLKQGADLSALGLEGPSVHYEKDLSQTLPFTSVNASTDEAMSWIPVDGDTPVGRLSSERGTPIFYSSYLPAGYFRAPHTGLYHNGTVDVSWATSTDDRFSIHSEDGSMTDIPLELAKTAMREQLGQEHDETFEAIEPAIDALPAIYYEIQTRTVGVDVTTEKANGSNATPYASAPQLVARDPDADPASEDDTEESNAFPTTPMEPRPLVARRGPSPIAEPPIADLTTQTVNQQPHDTLRKGVLATVAAVGTTIVLYALYSLFQPKDLLKNEVRRKVYAAIEANPGITVARLAEIVGVKHQTVSYHLKFLRKAGYVRDMECGNRRLHFIAGAGLSDEDRTLLTISNDVTTMRILHLIEENPGIIKRDLAPRVGLTRTAGTWHVNKLVQLGLITESKENGHCYLECVPGRYWRLRDLLAGPPSGMETEISINVPVFSTDPPLAPKPRAGPN